MPISDLCSVHLVTVEPGATLQRAARLMKDHHVGGLVVVEGNGKNRPIGILTDRDIVLAGVAEDRLYTSRVEDVMSKNVFKVSRNQGIADVIDQMATHGVRRMIVVDELGKACGLVSSDDILQLMAKEMSGLGQLVQTQLENERILTPIHDHYIL